MYIAVHSSMSAFLWASDLHLDHLDDTGRHQLASTIAADPAPIVLTGDLATSGTLVADLEWLAGTANAPLFFVLGNHDHYGGSVASVRDQVLALAERPPIRWLPPAGVVPLGDDWALIGVDGWADGRHGDPLGTPVRLNDDRLIAELAAQPSRRGRLAVRQALADADAARLETLLSRAIPTAHHIVVATHVPPFVESLPRTGRLAGAEWLPLLVCEATGQVLRRAAAAHPEQHFLVLAGHTHVATDVLITANLRCRVAPARYGIPQVETVTLDS